MEPFINLCYQLMFGECTHLIVIPFTKQFLQGWAMEDNHKRVLNRYYQYEISQIIDALLKDLYNLKYASAFLRTLTGITYGNIGYGNFNVNVLYLDEMDLEKRKKAVEIFLAAL